MLCALELLPGSAEGSLGKHLPSHEDDLLADQDSGGPGGAGLRSWWPPAPVGPRRPSRRGSAPPFLHDRSAQHSRAAIQKMRLELLSQEQPRAMHTRLDGCGGEAKRLSDLLVREALDVAQQHDGTVVGGQFVD